MASIAATFPVEVSVTPVSGRAANGIPKYGTAFSVSCRISSKTREINIGGDFGRQVINAIVMIFPPGLSGNEIMGHDLASHSLAQDSIITYGNRKNRVVRVEDEMELTSGFVNGVRAYVVDAGPSS